MEELRIEKEVEDIKGILREKKCLDEPDWVRLGLQIQGRVKSQVFDSPL